MPARKAKLKFGGYEVLVGLFHFWALKKYEISTDIRIFQNSLYFISKLPRYRKLCQDWQFEDRIGFKYCENISDLVTNMEMASMLDTLVCSELYVVFPKLHIRWEDIKLQDNLTRQDENLLEEMAERVYEKMAEFKEKKSY